MTTINKKTNGRDKILEASFELFARQGYANTTLRAIAAKAGVSLALVTFYFESKEGLYQELIDIITEHIRNCYRNQYDECERIIRDARGSKAAWDCLGEYLRLLIKETFLNDIYYYQLIIEREVSFSENNGQNRLARCIHEIIELPISRLLLYITGCDDELWARTITKAVCGSIRSFVEEYKIFGFIRQDFPSDESLRLVGEYIYKFVVESLRSATITYAAR